MQKRMLIFRGQDESPYSGFTDFMLQMGRKAADICHPQKFHMTFTDSPPPLASIIPFRKSKIGVLSLYFEDGISVAGLQRINEQCKSELKTEDGRIAGIYSVDEAIPVAYKKTWEDAELTPGICLLTLFRRKPGMSHAAFLDRWHNSHTPLSLRIHPLWHYSRNVVLETGTTGNEMWEGIVEEHFRRRTHLLNPFVFFGNPITMIPNMVKVYRDTKAFIDYKTIETYVVREVIIKSQD